MVIELPIWVGYILLAAAVAFIVGLNIYLLQLFRKGIIPFKPIPGYYPGAMYYAPPGYDLNRITAALRQAETLLIEKTRWTAAQTAQAGKQAYLYVLSTEAYTDLWGQHVAGEVIGRQMVVGYSLAALCHELAHFYELIIDGKVNATHEGWDVEGITPAIDAYEAWRTAQGWTA